MCRCCGAAAWRRPPPTHVPRHVPRRITWPGQPAGGAPSGKSSNWCCDIRDAGRRSWQGINGEGPKETEDEAVWTPKRILILIAGTFLFLAGFVVYDYFLGGYDGLPPLPEDCLRSESDVPIDQWPQRDPESAKKMRIAFGAEAEEARRKLILDSSTRNML